MAEQHGVSLVYGDELITHIVSRCPMHETGARLLIGYIEQHILPQLSRYWLQAMTEKTAITQIRIRVDEDEQIILTRINGASLWQRIMAHCGSVAFPKFFHQ